MDGDVWAEFEDSEVKKDRWIEHLKWTPHSLPISKVSNFPQLALSGSCQQRLVFVFCPGVVNPNFFWFFWRKGLDVLGAVVVPKSFVCVERVGEDRPEICFLESQERAVFVLEQCEIVQIRWNTLLCLLWLLIGKSNSRLGLMQVLFSAITVLLSQFSLEEGLTYHDPSLFYLHQSSLWILHWHTRTR